jgi:hypothetical protein
MNTILKRTLQTVVAAAIISGTYFGRGKDCPPLYSHKTGDAYGINVAVYTKIDSGASVNGLNLTLFTRNYGAINGVNIDIIRSNNIGHSKVNGINVGIMALAGNNYNESDEGQSTTINGLDAVLFNIHRGYVNGIQLGLLNVGSIDSHNEIGVKLNGLQIGVYNQTDKNSGILLNADYQKREK